jgi:CTD small phosphatase-like protein 2
MEEVLAYLAESWEIVVFTAGEQAYADAILNFIDEDRTIIKHRLYRHNCIKAAPRVYVKDLRIIADRELKDMVIVDNSIISFLFNMSNGVPIHSFTGDRGDEELMYMVSYLEEIYD